MREFNPSVLELVDESTMHAEHAAMRDSGFLETHFKYFFIFRVVLSYIPFVRVLIVSDAFQGKMPVKRHQMVYGLLSDEFQNGLHAINIVTKTPKEFESLNK